MPKFRKKPVPVEAIQFVDNGECLSAISQLVEVEITVNYPRNSAPVLTIQTRRAQTAKVGDWIIKGEDGISVCQPEVFEQAYEPAPIQGQCCEPLSSETPTE